MKKLGVLAALVLVLSSITPAFAARLEKSIDVIQETTTLGQSVQFTYVYTRELKEYGQYLLARLDCYANASSRLNGEPTVGVLLSQYAIISNGDQDFFIGTTPSWTSGGADCEVRLKLLDYWRGEIDLKATDTFEVLP